MGYIIYKLFGIKSADNKNELTIISNWWFNIDKQLLFCFLILSFFGLAVSFTIKPGGSYVDQVSLINAFTIQSVYLFAGVFIFLFLSFLDLKKLRKLTPLILIFLLIIFTLTIIPGFGIERKGSARWLDLILITLMPIELVKPVFCIGLALILESEPVSPINTMAGGALYHKKPRADPINAPHKIVNSPAPGT